LVGIPSLGGASRGPDCDQDKISLFIPAGPLSRADCTAFSRERDPEVSPRPWPSVRKGKHSRNSVTCLWRPCLIGGDNNSRNFRAYRWQRNNRPQSAALSSGLWRKTNWTATFRCHWDTSGRNRRNGRNASVPPQARRGSASFAREAYCLGIFGIPKRCSFGYAIAKCRGWASRGRCCPDLARRSSRVQSCF
jgi:hypothetical protein